MNNPSGPFMDNSSFENFSDKTTRRLKHPVITFFHLIFRSLALIGESAWSERVWLDRHCFSLSSLWLVFWQLHRQLRLHHPPALTRLLDCEKHHRFKLILSEYYVVLILWFLRSVHGRAPVVELHRQWGRVQVGVWVPVHWAGGRYYAVMSRKLAF